MIDATIGGSYPGDGIIDSPLWRTQPRYPRYISGLLFDCNVFSEEYYFKQ